MATRAFSIEDGNLNKQSITVARKRAFSDIDLLFNARPNGDLYKKSDAASIKQSVKNLLLTNSGEKPFSSFGGDLGDFLFELADADVEFDVRDQIVRAIENYEPRARILDIEVFPNIDRNEIRVKVTFLILNLDEIVTLETNITRLR